MPKSRGRKKAKRAPGQQTGTKTPRSADRPSATSAPSSGALWASLAYPPKPLETVEVPGALDSAEPPASPFTRTPPQFSIRISNRLIEWSAWPTCIAATKTGAQCTWPAYPEPPGRPDSTGAYVITSEQTFGSQGAEALRRLLTQRCHIHDGVDTPDAAAFQGHTARDHRAWLEQLRQQAISDAARAATTRRANQERLAATRCPTCGAHGSATCETSSGRRAPDIHRKRIDAAFGTDTSGKLPVV